MKKAMGGWLPATSPGRRRFGRFVLAAGASVPVNLASRIVLSRYVDFGVAVLLAHVVGMVTAYGLTRAFVFARSGRRKRQELMRFALVNLVSAAVTWSVSTGLVDWLFPLVGLTFQAELVAHVIGLGCSATTSFLGHSRFSFATAVDQRADPAGCDFLSRPGGPVMSTRLPPAPAAGLHEGSTPAAPRDRTTA